MSYQQTVVVGNVGSAAEMRYTPSGTAVSSFSLAVNEKFGDKQTTTWFRVTMWAQMAEKLTEYITKGKELLVVGTVSARGYTAKDGTAAASLELRATTVRFVGGKGNNGGDHADPTDSVNVEDSQSIPF